MSKKKSVEAKATPNNIKEEKIVRTLRVELGDDELLRRGYELAQAQTSLTQLHARRASIMAQLKADSMVHQATLERCSQVLATKSEWRDVDCAEVRNFSKSTLVVSRLDTGEIVEKRKLFPHEMQGDLLDELEEPEYGDDEEITG